MSLTLKDVRNPVPRRRAEKILAAINRASLGVFDNTTRPDPTTVAVGTQIYNTDDNAPNYSDGTNWRDSDGAIT